MNSDWLNSRLTSPQNLQLRVTQNVMVYDCGCGRELLGSRSVNQFSQRLYVHCRACNKEGWLSASAFRYRFLGRS